MVRTCDVDVGAERAQITSLRAVEYAVLPGHAILATASPFTSKRSTRTRLEASSEFGKVRRRRSPGSLP